MLINWLSRQHTPPFSSWFCTLLLPPFKQTSRTNYCLATRFLNLHSDKHRHLARQEFPPSDAPTRVEPCTPGLMIACDRPRLHPSPNTAASWKPFGQRHVETQDNGGAGGWKMYRSTTTAMTPWASETAEMRLSSRVVVRARRNCADGYIDARKAHAVVTMPRPCLAILMVQCMRVRRVGGTTEGKTADLEKNADVP